MITRCTIFLLAMLAASSLWAEESAVERSTVEASAVGESVVEQAPTETDNSVVVIGDSNRISGLKEDQCEAVVGRLLANSGKKDQARIARINVEQRDIFDTSLPEEDNVFFRLANRLHITTKQRILKKKLLFRRGDIAVAQQICESNRILRSLNYIDNISFELSLRDDGDVDVLVKSHELWTLSPQIKLSQSGGDFSSGIGFMDHNFLGLGKEAWFMHKSEDGRSGNTLGYKDNEFLGTRHTLILKNSDNDDGRSHDYTFELPFYSLDSRLSYGFNVQEFDRTDTLYVHDDVDKEFIHDESSFEVFLGWSGGLKKNEVKRWRVGVSSNTDEFYPETNNAASEIIPRDRDVSYFWVEHQYIENDYAAVKNYRTIERVEDIYLGLSYTVRLGVADKQARGDSTLLVLKSALENTLLHDDYHLLKARFAVNGYWNLDEAIFENTHLSTRIDYFFNTHTKTKNIFSFEYEHIVNPYVDKQLLLEGETTDQLLLRGYPAHYQAGDNRVLASAERRYFFKRHFFSLFYMAGAAFVDVGKSWDSDSTYAIDNEQQHNPLLANVGVGLRISQSRASKGEMIHLDLGFPMLDRSNTDAFQWHMRVRKEF